MATQQNKKDAAQRRLELKAKQAEMARAEKRRKLIWGVGSGVLVAILVAALTVALIVKNSNNSKASAAAAAASATQGETNLLAPTWSGLTGQTIDGVSSNTAEQLAYHIHAHLAIFVNGKQMTVPYGIGIAQPWTTQPEQDGSQFVEAGSAFYYLHTHDDTGIIHIESPTTKIYSLGQFFAEWNQPISSTQLGPNTGTVIAYVNGAKYTGNPAGIPMNAHDVIQLDLGKDVAPVPYTFPSGL